MISSDNSVLGAGLQHVRSNSVDYETAVSLLVYHLLNAAEFLEHCDRNYLLLEKLIKKAIPEDDPRRAAAIAFISSLNSSKADDDDEDDL